MKEKKENRKLKSIILNAWNKVSGKKTAVGFSLHTLWWVGNMFFPDMASDMQQNLGHVLIFKITGVGIGHKLFKFIKGDTGKKAIQIITRLFIKK